MATKRTTPRTAGRKTGERGASRQRILEAFASVWEEDGEAPKSVPRFCKAVGISQAAFYRHFPSLNAAEKAFWKEWVEGVIRALSSGGDWQEFTAKERYLAFLFAFVQASLERRCAVASRFRASAPIANPPALEAFRTAFQEFAQGTVDHGRKTGEIADRKALLKSYPALLYLHLRLVVGQLLRDESEELQRTDAFIEKTVTLAFDLFRSQALDSAIDLAKFLLPEKPWPWCHASNG